MWVRDNGYSTGMFGKQHGAMLSGETVQDDGPVDRGFDDFVGWFTASDTHQYFVDGATDTPGLDRRQQIKII